MVQITYLTHDGTEYKTDVPAGLSLMEGARNANVPGIVAECGGACACSTCHVYVDAEWTARLPHKEPMEEDMLDFAWEPDPERSRLSCQIPVTEELEGLVVTVPERQA